MAVYTAGVTIAADDQATRPAYRADIDGLRAVSVVAVILFHFSVPGFSGRYIGVDIFFVISGYLITQLLLNGCPSKSSALPARRSACPAASKVAFHLI